jgi:serine protease Do
MSPSLPQRGTRLRRLAIFGVAATLAIAPMATPLVISAHADTGTVINLPSFAPMVEKVLPAVVNISVVQKAQNVDDGDMDQGDNGPDNQQGPATPFDDLLRRFFEQQQQGQGGGVPQPPPGQKIMSLGSGFIIDPDGYIVTNNHVVGEGDKITVIFQDNSRHPAKIVGKDEKSDLALLKIQTDKPLPYVKWGDSDKARVGDWVIAVGDPFGLGGTVTKGIISARGRPIADSSYVDFLQIDAAINKGNSGGPTFDLDGNVIGINTAIYSPNGGSVGIGFAIPANTAKPLIEALREHGKVSRGWLGVQIQEITPEIAQGLGMNPDHPSGALVATVQPDTPAAAAGIQNGDVIVSFDGKKVDTMRDLPRLVGGTPVGKTVDIGVLRLGKPVTVQAKLAPLPDTQVAAANQEPDTQNDDASDKATSLGAYLANLNPEIRKHQGIPKSVQGVLVSRVKPNSPAADNDIEAGDVIVQINQLPVLHPQDAIDRLTALKGKAVLLLISRHGDNRFVAITPGDDSDNDN